MTTDSLRYAGFWRRLGAYLLDSLIQSPLGILVLWGMAQSPVFVLYAFLPQALFIIFYQGYLVQRFGGTPGKLIAGLCIRKVDGSPVGFREASVRFMPEFLFWVAIEIAMIEALSQITDADYFSLPFFARQMQLLAHAPAWQKPVNIANQIWIWSEFIVLLTNRKRRALHDFIAGTVVVVKNPPPIRQSTATVPAAGDG